MYVVKPGTSNKPKLTIQMLYRATLVNYNLDSSKAIAFLLVGE